MVGIVDTSSAQIHLSLQLVSAERARIDLRTGFDAKRRSRFELDLFTLLGPEYQSPFARSTGIFFAPCIRGPARDI
jgi:hypothetical protein